jgi:hypothetical protein
LTPNAIPHMKIMPRNSLGLPSTPTAPDMLAHTMLDVPLQQSSTLDAPTDKVYVICSDNLLWSPGCTGSGPSNPHDPGPLGADRFDAVTQSTSLSIATKRWPLRTLSSIDFGPSNPHDPGPSAAVADCIIAVFASLAFFTIANHAVVDFLFIPPRSPSTVFIVL